MFKIAATRTFTHLVTVMTPTDGGHLEETFKCTFNYLDTDQIAAFDLNTRDGTTDFLKAVVCKFDDLVDNSEQPVIYNDALRDSIIKLGPVRAALITAFFGAISKAKSGN